MAHEAGIRTTCPYCGVGCGVVAQTDGRRLIAVSGDPDHPANGGRLCVKGTALPETQKHQGRLLYPEVDGRRTDWDQALDRVADGFRETRARYGPGAVAFYLSGQLLTEDYYVANKLMKGFMGSANVDTNSRLCMASAVAAQKRAFGEDVVPVSYRDLDECELIVFVGSNAAWTHPVLYQQLAARKARTGLRVVVIDPRRTATCDIADLHLKIHPGADAALFNALLVALHKRGHVDSEFVKDHTRGFSDALATARADALAAEDRTGLDTEALQTFFDWFAGSDRVITFYSQGVNQASNGTDKANAIINAHLATGRIGRPGTGPFSITGQPNAMGGREVGGMANQLAAHRDFNPEDVAQVAAFWSAKDMASRPGLKAVEMFQAVAEGDIRAIWIMGTNPAVSLPDAPAVARALAACPLVVVSDCMASTETGRYAHVRLPAQGWGEKDGTVTNSERRISRQRGFLEAPGDARPDWWMVTRLARKLGFADEFAYETPADIFREHAALSGLDGGGRFDIGGCAGLSDADYDDLEPWQWGGTSPFQDHRFSTADGRAFFVPIAPHQPRQQPCSRFPFVLNTGRLRDQWHTMTRTGNTARLLAHTDSPLVDIHPDDADHLGLANGDLVEIHNDGGHLRGLVRRSEDVQPGQLFAAIHWNGCYASPCQVSDVIASVTDPVSGQPESKHGIAALTAVPVQQWTRWVSRDGATLPSCFAAGPALYRSALPGRSALRIEMALDTAVAVERLMDVGNLLSLTGPGRALWLLEQAGTIVAAGAAAPRRDALPDFPFLEERLESHAAADPAASWALLHGQPREPESRQICTCFEIREREILTAIDTGARTLTELQQRLPCGTNCGSCVPEIGRLLEAQRAQPVP